jgi:DNA polymerase-3 subunit delta
MSKILDLRSLQLSLQKQKPHSLYFVFGEESYLVGEAVARLRSKTLEQSAADFNFDQFFCPDVTGAQIRDVIEMLPVMAERRLVIVRNAHLLKEGDWKSLEPLIENPVESAVVIFVAEKIDRRKKIFKVFERSAQLVELKRPYDNQLPMWIDYIAKQENLQLNVQALHVIQQFVGNNLSEIQSELRKVGQFLGERKDVTAEDVMSIVSKTRLHSVFDLTKAIGRGDRVQALTCLASLLDNGYSEVAAVSMIARHVRILADVQEHWKQGLRGGKLSAQVGVPQFFLNEYLEQAQGWGERRISKTLKTLFETDKAIKSSPVSSHIWLENFIVATCEPN